MPFDRKQHWERIYSEKDEQETSWFQPRPETSLGLIEATGEPLAAPMIDVGGGTSRLVDHLLEQGWQNLSVLDISGTALEHSRQRLSEQAEKVNWIEADLLEGEPGGPYRIWHDRAVFHRCPPWRAKRRRVVPGSREATRDTRRAEGAKGDPKGASERGVQSYGRPVCSRNELAMLWRNAG